MERINEARAKITEESLEIKGALATFIEETVNEHCTTEEVANKILDGKEVHQGSNKRYKKQSKKKKAVNNMAAISDEEVRGMVLKYFEIDETKTQNAEVVDILDLI